MGITGSQPALMFNLSGVGRAGATRSNYHSTKTFLSLAGVQWGDAAAVPTKRVLLESLTVSDVLDETPNTCAFTVKGAAPTAFQEIIVTLGSINNLERLFAGHILNVTTIYVGQKPANTLYQVNCIDYTWQFNRRKVTKRYTNQSATAIAQDIVSTFTTGFTSTSVQGGLTTVDEISLTNVEAMSAIARLAERIGGYCFVDYHKTLHLFTTDATVTNPIDLTTTHHSLESIAVTRDGGQEITRVYCEGGGSTAERAAAVGQTYIPVVTDVWYEATGGTVVSGPQRITYTSLGVLSDLTVWSMGTIPFTTVDVAWAPSLGLFVAVQTGGRIYTSPDGATWTQRTSPVVSLLSVAWAPDISVFVAAGSNTVVTSPDGITWTSRTSANTNGWEAIAWAPALSLFAAVSQGGVANRIMTSPNGITWTARAADTGGWEDVAWSPSLGLFVAVGSSGTDLVVTSPDGITWTPRTAAAVANWSGVAWSPTLGLFAAVNRGGGVMTSSNGTAWTSRTASASNGWESIAWSPELGIFLAVASTGTNRVMNSSDGIIWTDRTTAIDKVWYAVTWAPALGRFVVVGASEAVMRNLAVPTLAGIPASGAGAIQYAIPTGDDVNLLVQVDDAVEQAAIATTIGAPEDGIIEEYLQDRRLSKTEALARAQAWLDLRNQVDTSLRYRVRDINTHAGRTITANLAAPTNAIGTFKIQEVTVANFTPGEFPTYEASASSVRYSFEDLLRMERAN